MSDAPQENRPPAHTKDTPAGANPAQTPQAVSAGLLFSGQVSRFETPFPPPEFLEQYDATVPGAAERIVAVIERQIQHGMELDRQEMAHRHELERRELDAALEDQAAERAIERTGQWIALGAVLAVLSLCAYGFYLGYPQTAGTIATSVLVALATVFVFGRTWKGKSGATEPHEVPPVSPPSAPPPPPAPAPPKKPNKKAKK